MTSAFNNIKSICMTYAMLFLIMPICTAAMVVGVQKAVTDTVQPYMHRSYYANAFIHSCQYRCSLYRKGKPNSKKLHHVCGWHQPPKQHRNVFTRSCIRMMPEGPEVRTVVDQLQGGVGLRLMNVHFVSGRYGTVDPMHHSQRPDGFLAFQSSLSSFSNSTVVPKPSSSSVVRTNITSNHSTNSTTCIDMITEWNCKGKFIYILLDNGKHVSHLTDDNYQRSIWITLGMTGRFLSESVAKENVSQGEDSHIRWYLELMNVTTFKTTKIYYSDVRQFGTIKFCFNRQILLEKLQSLGPDILGECTEQDFINILTSQKNQNLNICRFLMDQTKICGIGNYILAEGLYRANIDPFAALSELNLTQQQFLYQELRAVANESYQSQSTLSNPDCFEYQCYGQLKCKRRGSSVRRELNGPHGRTIWYTDEQLFIPRKERDRRSAANLTYTSSLSTQEPQSLQHASKTLSQISNTEDSRSNFSTSLSATDTPGNLMLASLLAKKPVAASNLDIHEESFQLRENVSVMADVKTLVASLLNTITEPGWKSALTDILQSSDDFSRVALFLEEERVNGKTVFPPTKEIFAALNLCPIDDVKVIIVGQDPYHRFGQSHGLAFSVRNGVRPPPSLQNIFKEVIDDVGIEDPKHGNLVCWAKQGVVLLNAVLTVREGEANSHAGKGWEEVTDEIIRVVTERKTKLDDSGLVFLLWGNYAFKKIGKVITDKGKHVVIQTSHPSPLGATKTNSPFLGSKCFSLANKALIQMGHDPIDWSIV